MTDLERKGKTGIKLAATLSDRLLVIVRCSAPAGTMPLQEKRMILALCEKLIRKFVESPRKQKLIAQQVVFGGCVPWGQRREKTMYLDPELMAEFEALVATGLLSRTFYAIIKHECDRFDAKNVVRTAA